MKKNQKNKKSKENNNLTITIIAVSAIIALIASGTYAYWTWVSANNTIVNIKVGEIKMLLDGGGNITAKNLIPTTCTNTTYAIQRTISYSLINETSVASTATIQLQPTTLPSQLKHAKIMWKLTTAANCGGTQVATGTFASASTSTPMNLTTVPVPAYTTTAITGKYYLSIWLDSSYTYQNVGETVSDPLQDKTMALKIAGTIAQDVS